ncbi:MAG: hypothetical protein ACLP59_10565 [Bryobacteraceae bacterium]
MPIDRIKPGRYLLALPMLIYPVLHFIYTDFVASIIPPWIPWHFFWTYFTAVTIFAAGLAMVFNKQTQLAATLLGIEIFLFCALIHLFLIVPGWGGAWAQRAMFGDLPSRLMNFPKDLGMSGACFILAGTSAGPFGKSTRDALLLIGRLILALVIADFGVLHFVYPNFAPGIEPMSSTLPFPIPGHLFWVYLTAVALLILAASIAFNWRTRRAALALGLLIVAFDLLTWGPDFIAHPGDLTGNWLKDLGIAGGAFILAEGSRTADRPGGLSH